MNKQDFLILLRRGLSGLPQDEINEQLTFYSEMIDDKIEEGLSEEEAVSTAGDINEIVTQAIAYTVPASLTKQSSSSRKLNAWEIVLLVLGSPIWLALLISAFAVIFSLYVSLWAVLISLWAVFGSFVASAFGAVLGGIMLICTNSALTGAALIGAGLVCVGFAIFSFFGCKAATKCTLLLTVKTAFKIKKRFYKKEEAR